MTRTYYGLSELDGYHSHEGELCVIVLSTYQYSTDHPENNVIYSIAIENDTYEDRDSKFVGASICRYVSSQYILNIEHTQYQYDKKGNPTNSAAIGTKLYLGTVLNATAAAGNVIPGTTDAIVSTTQDGTRASTVNAETSVSYLTNGAYQTVINSMNVRDEFANNALRGIISKIPDVTSLSKSEISYYCEQAYRWAEYMMTSCANTRASYSGTSGGVNTNNTDTEQYLQELVNGVNQSSQIGFTMQSNSPILIDAGYSKPYSNGVTFTINLKGEFEDKVRNSLIWSDLATASSPVDNSKIIHSSHLPQDVLKWTDLTTPDSTKKIDESHFPDTSGTFWGNQWSLGGNVNGDITMASGTRKIKVAKTGGNFDAITLNGSTDSIGIKCEPGNNTGNYFATAASSITLQVNCTTEFLGSVYLDNHHLFIGDGGAMHLAQASPLQYYIDGAYRTFITSSGTDLAFGYGTRRYRKTVISGGGEINFVVANKDNGANESESFVGEALKVEYLDTDSSRVTVRHSLCIGNAELIWDSQNSVLKLQNKNGAAAHFCSTGGVTALGLPSSNSGTVDNVSTKQLNIVGNDNTAKLFVEGNELRVTINNTTYRVNLTQIS